MGVSDFHRGPSGKILPGTKLARREILQRLKNLFPQTPVALAYLFGSYAHAQADSLSDVDLAVYIDAHGEALYRNYMEIMLAVQAALETERLDLLLLNSASPSMQFEVIRTGELIYARTEQVQYAFEMNVIRKYQDTAYLRAVQNEYLKKRVQQWYSGKKAY